MRILVTNDDGILASGLWTLVAELKKVGPVVVAAPSREQSAVGTAVTLRQPLDVRNVTPLVPDVEAYAVDGTPADSVILALGRLAANQIDLVVSGINSGLNLGDDVYISGTVGAALQGYLHGLPALAISTDTVNGSRLEGAAKAAALLARKIDAGALPRDIFLNVNLPDLPLRKIRGVKVTRLANHSHGNSVAVKQENEAGQPHYHLIRQRLTNSTDSDTDVAIIELGNISVTPLHTCWFNQPSAPITDGLFSGLVEELRGLWPTA